MKSLPVAILIFAFGFQALAVDEEKHEYFYGQAHIINLNASIKADQSPMLLLKKSTIPGQNLIVENATTPDDNGNMKDHIVYMKVDGQDLTITDADNSIEGTGTVSGEPWNWNLLKFSMVTKRGGIRIEDVNYRTPDRLIARKELFLPNGMPFMLWEVDAKEITKSEYEKLYSEMHSPIARRYVEGNKFGYTLTTKSYQNGQLDSEDIGESSHVVVKDSVLSEEITWKSLIKKTLNGAQDLSAEAQKVKPYRISLHQGGSLAIPPLEVPNMIGMITDLNTYYVAISHAIGINNLSKKGDVFQNPQKHKGDWTDGKEVVLGQDCTQATLTMVDLDEDLAVVKTAFLAPDSDCIEMKKPWMVASVKAGSPNNFQQIRKSGEKYTVMWGHEQFIIDSEIDRKTGMITKAEMDNTLTLKMKTGCDSNLENCQNEMPFTIQRNELLQKN